MNKDKNFVEDCNACSENVKDQTQKIVDNVDNYSHKDHASKKKEVEDAFDSDKNSTKNSGYAAAGAGMAAGASAGLSSDSSIGSTCGSGVSSSSKNDKYGKNIDQQAGLKNDIGEPGIVSNDTKNASGYDFDNMDNIESLDGGCGCGDDLADDEIGLIEVDIIDIIDPYAEDDMSDNGISSSSNNGISNEYGSSKSSSSLKDSSAQYNDKSYNTSNKKSDMKNEMSDKKSGSDNIGSTCKR